MYHEQRVLALEDVSKRRHVTLFLCVQARSVPKQYLSDYVELARGTMQLAAALTGCGDPTASHAFSMRSSASDENCNSANRELAGLMSPGAAALALQRSQAGAYSASHAHRSCRTDAFRNHALLQRKGRQGRAIMACGAGHVQHAWHLC